MYRAIALVALLIAGQQGAVVHELGHLTGARSAEMHVSANEATDGSCALCPLFAQAATAAVSHSFQTPLPLRAGIDRSVEHLIQAIDAAVLAPRSRGPPAHR